MLQLTYIHIPGAVSHGEHSSPDAPDALSLPSSKLCFISLMELNHIMLNRAFPKHTFALADKS